MGDFCLKEHGLARMIRKCWLGQTRVPSTEGHRKSGDIFLRKERSNMYHVIQSDFSSPPHPRKGYKESLQSFGFFLLEAGDF